MDESCKICQNAQDNRFHTAREMSFGLRDQFIYLECGHCGCVQIVEIPSDMQKALWEKFLTVTSVGGIGAVTRAPIGATRAIPETRRLLEQCMKEVFAIARSREIALADTIVADSMTFIDTLAADGTTSLQRDIIDGKPSELEYWNGTVVRLAREQGVAAPTNEFIYHSLLPQEKRARGVDASSP